MSKIIDITAEDIARLNPGRRAAQDAPPLPRPNSLDARAAFDRLVTLYKDQATIAEDIKQLIADAAEQEVADLPKIKRWAKLVADGKEAREGKKMRDLLEVADQLDLGV